MTTRDFRSISPSAVTLLMMKSLTDIPFAKDAASLIWNEEERERILQERRSNTFILRTLHFENRYKTVDQLLETVNPSNILELSSGFSCRGLAFARYRPVVYIDTDLPESSANKKELVNRLIEAQAIAFKGELHILPLNALDEEQFRAIMEIFPPGPVTIVNEGLLVYLDEQEKRKLCGIIHRVLHERGGCWITGDVYIRDPKRESITDGSDLLEERWSAFLREHKVEENKFATYEEASNFFASCGFRVSRKAEVKVKELSAMRFLPETVTEETVKHWVRNQQTWMLEAV